ncbi:MAG: UDP-N-acetylglucosamine 1-carboxyvinyltransferase, partial [Tissierellia bacterium]|nr:UDP-N-acetylglucosamine 1-carboxyvinyltransferase [Tissierellia bacterium]
AAAITGGDVIVDNVINNHLKPITAKLKEAGCEIEEGIDSIRVIANNKLNAIDIKTLPYPGFPTDMQAQFMALMSTLEGESKVIETVFENRFMHANELKKMGADIEINNRSASLKGVKSLKGAQVKASDLRAGAALVLAGLVADGTTEIENIYHIDRGYDGIEAKFTSLGAKIYRKTFADK